MLVLHEHPIGSEARESVSVFESRLLLKLFHLWPTQGDKIYVYSAKPRWRGLKVYSLRDLDSCWANCILQDTPWLARIVMYNLPGPRRAHRIRDISYETNASVIGLTGTRLPFYRAWDGYTYKSIISQHGWHFEVRWDGQARLSNMSAGVSIVVKKQMWQKNSWLTLELARKSWRHPISKLARRRHSNCDVLAFEDAKPGQSSSPRADIVQFRAVNQKDASWDAKGQHTVHYDWPQHLNGHCRWRWRKSTRLSLATSLHRKRKSRPFRDILRRRAWLWSTFPQEATLTLREPEGLWPRSPTLLDLQKCYRDWTYFGSWLERESDCRR